MSSNESFQVVWSERARTSVKEMSRQAASSIRVQLAEILVYLDSRLREDPLSLGEIYRSRGGIFEYLAVKDFLAINFAVDQEHRMVLVRNCRALSGRGLD